MEKTLQQYDEALEKCRHIFVKKNKDYGTAWRILRPSSLTDQIYIKAQRIRQLESNATQRIADNIESEYVGIVNYCLMAMVQLELPDGDIWLAENDALEQYDRHAALTRQLMIDKNHDYGEVWRNMRLSSLTDIILMKIFRIKQIEDNNGKTIISEGVAANYQDIMNYALFALIKLSEG